MLARLSHPTWFQAFGCVLGFDWHSSGVTTTVCGAMKEAMRQAGNDAGLYVAGGKGATSRKTPTELDRFCDRLGIDPAPLVRASRMTAKVDTSALQDGYDLYHHAFFLTAVGQWAVVQQGMSDTTRYARRYHWLGDRVDSFVEEPHAAIASEARGAALNLVAQESSKARVMVATLAAQEKPETLVHALESLQHGFPRRSAPEPGDQLSLPFDASSSIAIEGGLSDQLQLKDSFPQRVGEGARSRGLGSGGAHPHSHPHAHPPLILPQRHAVQEAQDIDPRRLYRVLLTTYQQVPAEFEALLEHPGVGPATVRALSLVADLVYGAPASTRDPAMYSFAHGGKDGYPYPVSRRGYDRTIAVLGEAVRHARMGDRNKLEALRRLADHYGADSL
jgi:hypothetical protein